MMDLQELTKKVAEIATRAGNFIAGEAENFNQGKVEYKGKNDLVSYVDKGAEKQIVSALSELLPEAGFITEEKTINKTGEVYNWIVDPLDGTTNFIHGLPTYSVSIALEKDKELVAGVVYEINRQECFSAWKDGGAWLNGQRIQISPTSTLDKSLIATGFPYYDFEKLEKYLNLFRELTQKCHGLRRIGSAAVDLAYTACGRFEAYYEYNINLYDIAAGVVLVREAGGKAFNFAGTDEFLQSREVIAGNSDVAQELKAMVQKYFA